MNNTTNNHTEIIEELKVRLGAEPEANYLDEEETRFLEQRNKLEEEMLCSFDKYLEHYEEIKAYGLDLHLIYQLEWLMLFKLENKKEEFMASDFYQKFKNHEVVLRAFSEHERRMELEK